MATSASPAPGSLIVNDDEKTETSEFPNEIMQEIMSYLSVKDLKSCSLVSKRWKSIADNIVNNKYDIYINRYPELLADLEGIYFKTPPNHFQLLTAYEETKFKWYTNAEQYYPVDPDNKVPQ